jgi:hypothetical protein
MPRVPTIISDGNTRAGFEAGGYNPAAANAIASSANSLASGISDIGRGLLAINDRKKMVEAKLAQKKEQEDTLWAESQFTTAQRDWIQWTSDVQKQGEENVLSRFNTEFDEYQQQVVKSAPSKEAAAKIKMRLDDLGTSVFDSSIRIQAANQAKNTITIFENMVTTSTDSVAKSPELYAQEQERLGTLLKTSLDAGRISEETYQKQMDQVNGLAANAAEALLATNPERAKAIIDKAEGIPWPRRRAILSDISRASQSNETLFRYQQEEIFKSSVESLAATGKVPSDFNIDAYVLAFPKDQQAARKLEAERQIHIAGTLYVGKNELKGKTPNKVLEALASYEPKPGDKNFSDQQAIYSQLQQAADQQIKLFKSDPFSYSRQDPIVDKAWETVENLPQDADPAVVFQTQAQAIEASISFQRSSGVPEHSVSVMSRDTASKVAAQINNGDPKQVQDTFGQLMQTYGKNYPLAFRTLARLPEGQRIDAATQIVALHYGKPFIGDFLQAIRVPDSDYKLDKSDKKAIEEKLLTNESFMAFAGSMTSANPAAVSMVNDYSQAIQKYATSLVYRGKATSSDAVQQASDLVIGQAYGFAMVNDTPLAIKRQQGPSLLDDRNIENIQRWLKRQPSTIEPESIDLSRFAFTAQITDDVKMQSVRDTLRNDTFWVTSPDNSSAILYMNGMDGSTAPVKLKDGAQVEVKFTEASSNWENLVKQNKLPGYRPGFR